MENHQTGNDCQFTSFKELKIEAVVRTIVMVELKKELDAFFKEVGLRLDKIEDSLKSNH